jgi:hypothetical protein
MQFDILAWLSQKGTFTLPKWSLLGANSLNCNNWIKADVYDSYKIIFEW